jgi:hypothetical protein
MNIKSVCKQIGGRGKITAFSCKHYQQRQNETLIYLVTRISVGNMCLRCFNSSDYAKSYVRCTSNYVSQSYAIIRTNGRASGEAGAATNQGDNQSRWKEAEMKMLYLIATVLFLGLCGLAAFAANMPAPPVEEIEFGDVQPFLPAVGYILAGLFVIWIIKKIVDVGLIVPIFVIICGLALVISISWVYTYGDKNNDGVGDSQIVIMVQPSGNDAITDSSYSKTNLTNAKANTLSVASIMGYTTLIYAGVILFALVGAYLHFLKK